VQSIIDPVLGQGANMASYAALILGEQIVEDDVYDARFVEKVDARRRDRVLSAMRWTNYMLVSLCALAPELLNFIGAISRNRPLADEFTENFNYPEVQWDCCFFSPARIESWIQTRVSQAAERKLVSAA
jgi:styrene monooxygenase